MSVEAAGVNLRVRETQSQFSQKKLSSNMHLGGDLTNVCSISKAALINTRQE